MGMILLANNISRSNRSGHVRAPEGIVSLQHELQDEARERDGEEPDESPDQNFGGPAQTLAGAGPDQSMPQAGGKRSEWLARSYRHECAGRTREIVTWLCQAAGLVVDTAWGPASRSHLAVYGCITHELKFAGDGLAADKACDPGSGISATRWLHPASRQGRQHLIALAGHAAASARGWLQR